MEDEAKRIDQFRIDGSMRTRGMKDEEPRVITGPPTHQGPGPQRPDGHSTRPHSLVRNPSATSSQVLLHPAPAPMSSLSADPSDCGTQSLDHPPITTASTTHRMTHGRGANRHSWPWHVSVGIGNRQICSGSLLQIKADGVILDSTDIVLTAARCFYDNEIPTEPERILIRAGVHNLHQLPNAGEERREASGLFLHEQYLQNRGDALGIIVMKSPIKFNDIIRPICLPDERIITGGICFLTGWGHIYNEVTSEFTTPDELQQSYAPIQFQPVCQRLKFGTGFLYDIGKHACAGDGNSYPGPGDFGGPLQCLVDDRWIIYGLLTDIIRPQFAVNDDHKNPALYNRIGRYSADSKWIQATIISRSKVYRAYRPQRLSGTNGPYPTKITYPIEVDSHSLGLGKLESLGKIGTLGSVDSLDSIANVGNLDDLSNRPVQLRKSHDDNYYVEWISPKGAYYYVVVQGNKDFFHPKEVGHNYWHKYAATAEGRQAIVFPQPGFYAIRVVRSDEAGQLTLDEGAHVRVDVRAKEKHIADAPVITFPKETQPGQSVVFPVLHDRPYYVEWDATDESDVHGIEWVDWTVELFNVVVHSDPADSTVTDEPYVHLYSRVARDKSNPNPEKTAYRQVVSFPRAGKYVIKVAQCDRNGAVLSAASAVHVTYTEPDD